MRETELKISGMNCMHCVMAVKKEFSKLNLDSAEVEIGKARIKYDESKIDFSMIEAAVVEAGFHLQKEA